MKKSALIIATRESPLAVWQANWVKTQLEALHPNLAIHLLGLTTEADKMITTPLYKIGGKGLFVKELEEALLNKQADIAVHSMKDVPMTLPEGLCLAVMCQREEPRDVWVSNHFASLKALPKNAIVGTSSLRRQSQLLALRRDIKIIPLRGNVNTRIDKLDREEFSAIILAAAGLQRLNLTKRIRAFLPMTDLLPAAGQGVLGIECRIDDMATQKLISPLHHVVTAQCILAERALCRYLEGDCQTPIAAYAEKIQNQIHLRGLVASEDGKYILKAKQIDACDKAEKIGEEVAEILLRLGAKHLLHHAKH